MAFDIKYKINGHSVYAMVPYYPKNRYKDHDLEENYIIFRSEIYSFKDGSDPKGFAEFFSKQLLETFNPNILRNTNLVVIPASTEDKTKRRFEIFCTKLCEQTGMNNRYDLIINKGDHEAGHISGYKPPILDCVKFTQAKFHGKYFVIDDIITRGIHFADIAGEITRRGAESVTGIFFGRTTYKDTYR